jgi:transcriptional regulator with GAF, ATPase, and Fis domain
LIIADLSQYTYWESVRAMRAAGLKTTMAFPLIVRDRLLGVLHFSFIQPPDRMEEVVRFLEELSVQVALAVDNMIAYTTLRRMNKQLLKQKDFLASQHSYGRGGQELFYRSPDMARLIRQAEIAAESDISVLIAGETGTGKDLIAKYIHQCSPRRRSLMVKVNCPALTATLFESELFGHAKGAFTGAGSSRVGRFEMADGGTIFLDEIGELDPPLQAKLLNVLQDRSFERVGDSRSIKADFRLLSATNKDLESGLRDNTFRSDLYYRLNTITLRVPPLRERVEDVPVLVERLAAIRAGETRRPAPVFSKAALKVMAAYPWPGNVRELKNIVNHLGIMRPGETISGSDLEAILGEMSDRPSLKARTLAEVERLHIIRTLEKTGGQVGGAAGAAALLGVPRQTLQYRMRKYGINPRRPQDSAAGQ